MNASEVMAAIRTHYGDSAVVVPEVGNAVGFATRRHMDAVAVGCWPSRGLFVHAIEIKVSKSDLKAELKAPEKADAIAKYCDKMWLAAPKGIADADALPDAWGLFEVTDKGVRVAKAARDIEAVPLTRAFVVAMVRAAAQRLSEEHDIQRRIDDAVAKARADSADGWRSDIDAAHLARRAAEQELADLRRALSGSRFWANRSAVDVGKAMIALDSLSGTDGALNSVRANARMIVEQADALEAAVKAGLGVEGTP